MKTWTSPWRQIPGPAALPRIDEDTRGIIIGEDVHISHRSITGAGGLAYAYMKAPAAEPAKAS
jgi:hypothetical protein